MLIQCVFPFLQQSPQTANNSLFCLCFCWFSPQKEMKVVKALVFGLLSLGTKRDVAEGEWGEQPNSRTGVNGRQTRGGV